MSRPIDDSDDNAEATGGDAEPRDGAHPLGWKVTLGICALILLSGVGAITVMFLTEPTTTRGGATRDTAMLVETVEARAGTYRPTIVATGTVRPAREIVLRPRVGGEVLEQAEALVPGGNVAAGEFLLRLDASDYRNALRQRRNELDEALAEQRIEQGRQRLAEQEIRLIEETLTGENRALVLREPQIEAARSRVASARTAVEQARLQLRRTTIEAPFDAHVLSREVNVGSRVAAGDALAHLVGTETYWIETTVPVSKLQWLEFPGEGETGGAEVRIRHRGAWPGDVHRTGRLYKRIGTLDDTTRMARVLVAVADPLARATPDEPPLLIGTHVQTRIRGRELPDVVRVDRDHLRRNNTVWVMREGRLDIREVRIAVRDSEHAYVSAGLETGDRIVTSNLATVEGGVPLRERGSEPSMDASAGDEPDPVGGSGTP